MCRCFACWPPQFSAATGLAVTDTGVVNDANPTSSDAILAQTQTLVLLAEQLTPATRKASITLRRWPKPLSWAVPRRAAGGGNQLHGALQKPIHAEHFRHRRRRHQDCRHPAHTLPTQMYLEMIGFDQADIRRIKAQERRARGQQILTEELGQA